MAGFTFVDSTKYGSHVRAARGTHKKATCNDAFKKVSSRTALLNKALGPPYHFFKDRYYPFMNGVVWSQMQSRARRSEKDDLLSLMMTMEGLELNQRYSFANLVVDPDVTVTYSGQMIYVDFGAKAHPAF
ncbi:MAG: hypothetical protein NVSMB63_03280 [Sediminibacterium sp.]